MEVHGKSMDPWTIYPKVHGIWSLLWTLCGLCVDFVWTFHGLSVDKIYNFAVGLTQNQKVRGKSTESPQKSMGTQKSMESMGSIWNRWGSVKTSTSGKFQLSK